MSVLKESNVSDWLDWIYQVSVNGYMGFVSAEALAESYQRKYGGKKYLVDKLILHEALKVSSSSFLGGAGGAWMLPVTLPLNITTTLIIQIRMIATIAIIHGHSANELRVKALIYACLCGDITLKVISSALTEAMYEKIINRAALVVMSRSSSCVSKSIIRGVPIVGALVGSCSDFIMTKLVGRVADKLFSSCF